MNNEIRCFANEL